MDVAVNGKSVPFNMKIGEAGEAFFIFETDSDVPDDLITSPLLEPTEPVSSDPLPLEDFGRFGARDRKADHMDDGVSQEPDFLDLDAPSTSLSEVSKTSFSNLPQPSSGAFSSRAGDSFSLINTRNETTTISVEPEKEIPRGVVSDIELDMGGYHTLHTLKAQRMSSPRDDAGLFLLGDDQPLLNSSPRWLTAVLSRGIPHYCFYIGYVARPSIYTPLTPCVTFP